MAWRHLDAFACRASYGTVLTFYQMIDDATRYDVGSRAYQQHKNRDDAHELLARAIKSHGTPREPLG